MKYLLLIISTSLLMGCTDKKETNATIVLNKTPTVETITTETTALDKTVSVSNDSLDQIDFGADPGCEMGVEKPKPCDNK